MHIDNNKTYHPNPSSPTPPELMESLQHVHPNNLVSRLLKNAQDSGLGRHSSHQIISGLKMSLTQNDHIAELRQTQRTQRQQFLETASIQFPTPGRGCHFGHGATHNLHFRCDVRSSAISLTACISATIQGSRRFLMVPGRSEKT